LLFAVTAMLIFVGFPVVPTTSPLPFYAYPVLVATMAGWIWTLLKPDGLEVRGSQGRSSLHLQQDDQKEGG
jgi:hypothetical protein